jgi:DNA-binding NarL/FixJ family response regulator
LVTWKGPIRVLVVASRPLVREGLVSSLDGDAGIIRAGTVETAAEACELVARLDLDVVVADWVGLVSTEIATAPPPENDEAGRDVKLVVLIESADDDVLSMMTARPTVERCWGVVEMRHPPTLASIEGHHDLHGVRRCCPRR